VPSYPPCFEVTYTADATGAPPLTFTWTLPDGTTLSGNPLTLDTGLLSTGFNAIELEVTNGAGAVIYPVSLVVEDLAFTAPPKFTPADETTIAAVANTTGATEWRWSWGDGTVSPWTTGCAGYAPTHTYPAPGLYTVSVEARSCRSGPLTATGILDLGGATTPLIETFEAVCLTAPFCTFDAGEIVAFRTIVSASPDAYLYDWNADGFDDEVSATPAASHVFVTPGFYTPRLTVLAGTASDRRDHEAPIQIVLGSTLLFDHDFENGSLAGWIRP
jgi:PKD repeat protein